MRYSEFGIKEARSNPAHPAQAKLYLERYLASLPSLNNIYLHYTNVDKIGINPKSDWYETPPGIYTYAASDYWSGLGDYVGVSWKPGFARNSRWVFVIQMKDTARMLDFGNYSVEQFKIDLKKLGKTLEDVWPHATDAEREEYLQDAADNNKTHQLAHSIYQMVNWRRNPGAFRKTLGYDGINDPGYGYIHKNEWAQTVFFTRDAFDVLKQIKDYPDTNKHKLGSAVANPAQVVDRMRAGQIDAIKYLGDQKIDLPPDLQLKLADSKNMFGRTGAVDDFTSAIQKVNNPTDDFYKRLIDHGYDYIVLKSTISDDVKVHLVQKDPINIVHIKNPPQAAKDIALAKFGPGAASFWGDGPSR